MSDLPVTSLPISNHPATDARAAGETYEPLTGRWSRLIAPQFIRWLDVGSNARWLDVGCGTGALIQAILDTQQPAEIVGIDPNSAFIAYARREIADGRVRYEVGDARELPVPSRQYHAVVAGLVLNHLEPAALPKAMAEMRRSARQGGVVGAYVWDYAEGMEPRARFWETAARLDPEASAWDERLRYPLCAPDALQQLFERARLNGVETRVFEVEARFASFEDYWEPYLAGAGLGSRYLLSLPAERREVLRNALHHDLPVERDGSITLTIRAWGVQGVA